jgi:hypothetical protein
LSRRDANIDGFKAAVHRFPLRAVLHPLHRCRDVAGTVAFDGKLSVYRPGQASVAARPGTIDPAVMDNIDSAAENFADDIGGADLCGHVLIATLGTYQRAMERI